MMSVSLLLTMCLNISVKVTETPKIQKSATIQKLIKLKLLNHTFPLAVFQKWNKSPKMNSTKYNILNFV